MRFFWSEFNGLSDISPKFQESTWSEFVASRMHFTVTTDKKTERLYSAAEFLPGKTRSISNVHLVSAIIYDLDDWLDEEIARLRLSIAPYEHVLHTTAGHLQPPKGNRYRLILPLERPATRKEFHATREAFAEEHGFLGRDDAKARHEAVPFFWPAHVEGGPHELIHQPGRLVTVNTTRVVAFKESKTVTRDTDITGEKDFKGDFLKRWASSDKGSETEAAYIRCKNKLPLGKLGGRDAAIQSLVWLIANRMTMEQLQKVDENYILDFLTPSIEATPFEKENDKITREHVREKLRRARRDVFADKTGEAANIEEAINFETALFTNAETWEPTPKSPIPIPVKPWTQEEKDAFKEKYFKGGDIKHVLSFENRFIVFDRKGFSRRLRDNEVVDYAIQEKLNEAGCQLTVYRARTNSFEIMNSSEFVRANGVVLRGIQGSFEGISCYDPETQVYTEVVNPIREIEPLFDPVIDQFLKAFCEKERDYHALLAWLKRFPDLSQQSNILFLYGRKNTGKSMLSAALSRYWNRTKGTDPESYFGSFQDALLLCPYVMADEGLPKKMTNSQEVRAFVTNSEHAINRKGIAKVNFKGYLRMVVNSNDLDNLKFSDDELNQASIEAVDARFLRIAVSDRANAFIEEQGANAWTDTLVKGDKFIRHVEFLRQNYTPKEGLNPGDTRFASTNAPEDRMHDRARLDAKNSEPICSLIWHCLNKAESPEVRGAWEKKYIFFHTIDDERVVHVNTKIASDSSLWNAANAGQYVEIPTPRKVSEALRRLSVSKLQLKDARLVRLGEKVLRAWPVETSLLKLHVIHDLGYTEADFEAAFNPKYDENGNRVVLQS